LRPPSAIQLKDIFDHYWDMFMPLPRFDGHELCQRVSWEWQTRIHAQKNADSTTLWEFSQSDRFRVSRMPFLFVRPMFYLGLISVYTSRWPPLPFG